MTSVYRLDSLKAETLFDPVTEEIGVPVTLRGGNEVPLWLCDGVEPAPRRLLRLLTRSSLVGLRTSHRDRLRVRLSLLLDERADDRWERAARRAEATEALRRAVEPGGTGHDPSAGTGPGPEEEAGPSARGEARVIAVHAQGVARAAAVLTRPADQEVGRQVVTFDVTAEDMADGRLLLGFTSPAGSRRPLDAPQSTPSTPLGPSVAPDGAVGCAVGWVDLSVPDPEAPLATVDESLSTGSEDLVLTHGVLAAGPAAGARSVRLSPAGRLRPGSDAPAPRVVDADGAAVTAEVRRDGASWLVDLPASPSPSFVLADPAARFGRPTRWVAAAV